MRFRGKAPRRLGLSVVALAALAASTAAFGAGSQGRAFQPGTAARAAGSITSTATKDVGASATAPIVRNGLESVIVRLDVAPVASYAGTVKGYPATRARAGHELNLGSPEAQAYLAYVDNKVTNFAALAQAAIPQAQVTATYDVVYGGVAMRVPPDSVAALGRLPGVTSVQPDVVVHTLTDRSPQFLGAPTIWNSVGAADPFAQNEVVAVLDTGIWPEHPSFAPSDDTGLPFPAPPPPRSGTRQCQFGPGFGSNPGPAFSCNNKLIAAQRFMSTYDSVIGPDGPGSFTSARDNDGHGTHTTSTAAGDHGVQASIFGVPRGTLSGIAPRAHVMMYKVCGAQGCFGSDTMQAVQKAVTDGANVINYSISGGENPYSDPTEQAFLDAYNAGVFVAASAGNSGPTPDTAAHRGPWTMTVAASTHDRTFNSHVTLRASNGDTVDLPGVTLTAGVTTPTPVVNAADAPYNDPLCQNSTADGAFAGKIVVCRRGVIGRAQKGFNVKQRGAVGMILYNTANQDVETDNHWVPAIHLNGGTGSPGEQLTAFLSTHTGIQGVFPAGTKCIGASCNPSAPGDVMAAFSSRGGPGQTLGISKPDVTAPGVQILAGNTPAPTDVASGPPGQLFQAIAGTSMSSPHVAGAGALVKSAHPLWTPGQIKSALMTTAKVIGVVKENGVTMATPFDDGSGRIDLNKAADPGITFSDTGANYNLLRDQLYRSNYPSVFIPRMPGIVSVDRTAHSVLSTDDTWTLRTFAQPGLSIRAPASIFVPAGSDTTFTIRVDGSGLPQGAVRYGYVKMDDAAGRTAVLPVTIVRGQSSVTFNKSCTPASFPKGSSTKCTITATNVDFSNDAHVDIDDQLPPQLQLVPGSVTGATPSGNGIHFTGTIPKAQPPTVTVALGSSPAGYLPLSAFGVPAIANPGDDAVFNFNVPSFPFAGENWTRIGFSTNGYAIVGGATSASDNAYLNQNMPDSTPPNNVLAPFWADLNLPPTGSGAMRIATLTDSQDTWIVLDWDAVKEFCSANTHRMEIWIGVSGDAHPAEDVTWSYGTTAGTGCGAASVGAENKFGNRGQTVYYNGTGTPVTAGQQYRVTTSPGSQTTKTITFDALGALTGTWRNCAQMTSDTFYGTAVACFDGEVTP